MSRLISSTIAAVAIGLSAPAGAADILHACAGDIAEYCPAVEAGNGRIASCLYAHETVISDACYVATSDVGDFLDSMFGGLRIIYEACGADISNHCSGVPAGEGRILSCLAESRGDLSAGCAPAVDQFTALWPKDDAAQ